MTNIILNIEITREIKYQYSAKRHINFGYHKQCCKVNKNCKLLKDEFNSNFETDLNCCLESNYWFHTSLSNRYSVSLIPKNIVLPFVYTGTDQYAN